MDRSECIIPYILYVLGHCLFWDTLDFCQNNYFSGLQVLGHIKNLRKKG